MLLEHNPRHYTPVKLFGETYNICSRCLGTYSMGIISFIVFAIIHFYGFTFSFYQIALPALGMGFICFIDWISSKTSFWQGDNKVRILTGGFLGVAISMWFWLLPVDLFTRIWTLIVIEAVFSSIVFFVNYHEIKKGLFDMYSDYFNNRYGNQYMCECCGTVCCLGPKLCCYASLILCCCICPIVLCLLLRKGG